MYGVTASLFAVIIRYNSFLDGSNSLCGCYPAISTLCITHPLNYDGRCVYDTPSVVKLVTAASLKGNHP